MIVWRGWGFLAFVIPLGLGILAEQGGKAVSGDGAGWYFQSGFGAGLAIVWFLGRWLNNKPEKILIDPETGEQVVLRGGHSLFWIPMQYWAFIGLAVMAVAGFREFIA
jgi:hypothetical protein